MASDHEMACEIAWRFWCQDAPPIPAALSIEEVEAVGDLIADYDRGAITAAQFMAAAVVVKVVELMRAESEA